MSTLTAAAATEPDLRQPAFGHPAPQELSAAIVATAALVGSLLGWALMARLERLTSNPRRAWSIVAPLALLVSLSGPLSGHGLTGGNRLALVLMHLAVASVVIALYHRSSPRRGGSGERRHA